jgi:hypothetical protein
MALNRPRGGADSPPTSWSEPRSSGPYSKPFRCSSSPASTACGVGRSHTAFIVLPTIIERMYENLLPHLPAGGGGGQHEEAEAEPAEERTRDEHPELLGEIDTHDAVMEGVRLVLAHGQRALVLERERLGHREFNLKFTVLTHNFPVDPAI